MIERLVREPERKLITQRSPAQWWRDERDGKAPRRLRIGANAVGWKMSELISWLESLEVILPENTNPVAPGTKRGRKPKTLEGAKNE